MKSCDDGYPTCRKAEATGEWCKAECESAAKRPLAAAACSPSSDTPETERKVKRICGNWNNAGDRVQEFVLADFARKLERERDEARKTLRGETNLACERTRLLHDEMEKSWNLTQEVESLIKQRDEARATARDMRNQLENDSRARLIFPWENAEHIHPDKHQ